jgi:release factor-specific protein-(glutamine-N5) methyltransferase
MSELWTVRRALEWTCGYLERKGDEHPRLSAEWLLCAATGFSRVELYMNYDRPLDADELSTLHDGVVRRGKGEPLQYVTGEMPFRHIVLRCAPGVLIPRPETEVLVDCVLAYLDGLPEQGSDASPRRVLEVGVGTGCISLSVAGERSGVEVVATDVSPEAVALACRNRDALGLDGRVDVRLADLTDGVPGADEGAYDVLVSNPPYIPSELVELLPAEVGGYEPRLALDGGPDGLDVFRRLVAQAARALRPGGLLACELHEECLQLAAADPLLQEAFADVRVVRDLTGRDRVLLAELKGAGERA